MFYVVCFPRFAPRDAERLAAFRTSHDREQGGLIDAHFTLVFGTRTPLGALEQRVRGVAGRTSPFPVEIKGLDMVESEPGLHLLYGVPGEGDAPLRALHEALNEDGMADPGRFDPHVTLARSTSRRAIAQALEAADALALPISATVDHLAIVERTSTAIPTRTRVAFS